MNIQILSDRGREFGASKLAAFKDLNHSAIFLPDHHFASTSA